MASGVSMPEDTYNDHQNAHSQNKEIDGDGNPWIVVGQHGESGPVCKIVAIDELFRHITMFRPTSLSRRPEPTIG